MFFKSVVSLSCQLAVRYSEQQSSPNCWNPTIFFCFWSGFDWILSCFLSQFASRNIRGLKCYVTVIAMICASRAVVMSLRSAETEFWHFDLCLPLLSRYLARGGEEQPRKIFGQKWKNISLNICKMVFLPFRGPLSVPGGSGSEGNLSGKYLIRC